VRGVFKAGLRTIVLPVARQGATLWRRLQREIEGSDAEDHPEREALHESEMPCAGRAGIHRDSMPLIRQRASSGEAERQSSPLGFRFRESHRLAGFRNNGGDEIRPSLRDEPADVFKNDGARIGRGFREIAKAV